MAKGAGRKQKNPRPTTAEQAPVENALSRIRVGHSSMAKGARRIADFILEDPSRIIKMSVTELSEATDSSEGSIINFGEALFKFLSPALLAAITYFPGAFSNNRLRFDRPSGKLHVTGGFAEGFVRTAREVSNDLARHWRALGAIAMSRAKLAMPGVDAHFVGTLPMGGRAANGTSSSGELSGFSGLHIVDGSVLPTLPSKHATLTIMANADRIGTLLSRG